MMSFSTSLKLSACALAASVLISACGGGAESTDTVAPRVVITSAAATSGVVTFTFAFSESVGTSFVVEDIAVTGATLSDFKKVNALTYTVAATPTGAGSVSVTLRGVNFKDEANNVGNADVTSTYVAGIPGQMDFSASNVALQSFGGIVSAEIAADPVAGASNKVLKIVKGPLGPDGKAAAGWAGTTVYTAGTPDPSGAHSELSVDRVNLAVSKVITMKVYSTATIGNRITLKLENAADPGVNILTSALTTKKDAWETLTFDFGALDAGVYSDSAVYNTISIFPAFSVKDTAPVAPAANTTYYFDDLTYAVSGSVNASAPSTAAPTPIAASGNVLSIYSDTYTPVGGVVLRPDWGQSTVVDEVLVAGNKTQKYTAFNYEGITFTPIDVSSMSMLHIDVWTPDLTALDVFVLAGGAEQSVKLTPSKSGWNSFDIDLSQYTTLNKAAVKELKLLATGGSTLYFDNLYFAKAAPLTAPSAAAPVPAVLSNNVLSIYSDTYTPVGGVVLRPDWGQSTVVDEVLVAGNKTQKYTAFNYEGITFTPIDVSSMSMLHIDVWTPDLTALDVFVLAGGAEQSVKLTPSKSGWNSFDIDLSQYTTLNKAAVKELKLVATGGSTVYFDNLYFWKSAATLAFSSGYTNPVDKGGYWEGATAEGGVWGYYSGNFAPGTNTFTGGEGTYRYIGTASNVAPTAGYMGVYNVYKAGGLTLSGQASVTVELAADADYIASGKQSLRIDVKSSQNFNNGQVTDCQLVVSGVVKPTSTTLTAYKVPLTTLGQACNQSTITTVASVLSLPIGNVSVTADWPNINNSVANSGTGKFVSAFTLGKITFTP